MESPDVPSERPRATALLIKWADMAARSRLEVALRPWQLSAGQLLALVTLERMGEASSAELSRAMHLSPQAMTTLLKPLAERGLIARRADPANLRRLELRLALAGGALLAEVRQVTPQVDADITGVLSAAEIVQLRALLAKIAGGAPE